MIRRPPRSTLSSSSAASDVYKRQRPGRGLRFLGTFRADLHPARRAHRTTRGPRPGRPDPALVAARKTVTEAQAALVTAERALPQLLAGPGTPTAQPGCTTQRL